MKPTSQPNPKPVSTGKEAKTTQLNNSSEGNPDPVEWHTDTIPKKRTGHTIEDKKTTQNLDQTDPSKLSGL